MIRVEKITKTFESKQNRFTALHDVSFTVQTGEIFGIVGESGAGKSTLLRCIINLEEPTSGTITIDNQLLDKNTRNTQQKTATIFQNYNLLSNKNVYDNVALPLRLTKTYDSQRVIDALRFVGLSDKARLYPAKLSGGEKQRLGIARAIVSRPKYLICDEPTSALDRKTAQDMIELLRRVNKQFDTTIVIVTHELGVAKALCDRVALLEQGKLIDVIKVAKDHDSTLNKNYIELVREVLQ